jgi:hypothetical protein
MLSTNGAFAPEEKNPYRGSRFATSAAHTALRPTNNTSAAWDGSLRPRWQSE